MTTTQHDVHQQQSAESFDFNPILVLHAWKLIIAEQTCLLEEKFSKNGVQKNVHVVVKNTPFTITLALLDKQSINFNQFSADVQLVYDCPTLKEVDFVKLKPMEFKLKPSEEGDQLAVELRIKVLTSQLEDMFFRVRLALIDPRTLQEVSPQFVVLSHPIRVVSKPDQVKKKIKKRKRAPTDNLMDTLTRIEAQQKEQQRLLKRLCIPAPSALTPPGTTSTQSEANAGDPHDGFHKAFTDFLAAFSNVSTSEDAFKVNTSAQDAQTMCEILDLMRAELKRTGHYAQQDHQPAHEHAHEHTHVHEHSHTQAHAQAQEHPNQHARVSPPEDSPPHSAAASHISSSPLSSSLPILSPSITAALLGPHNHTHTHSLPPPYYREKIDANSLEGELFSNCGMSQQGMMHGIGDNSYSFVPFQDLSSMFASQ